MADRIVTELANHKTTGLIFPDDPNCIGWTNNYPESTRLAQRLGIGELPKNFNFPIGSMFWAKKGALTKLYEMKLDWEDFPVEPIGYDGTILHSVERIIPFVAKNSGYTYKLTYVDGVTR